MRCNICDKKLEAQEIAIDERTGKWKPCMECLEVAWDINNDVDHDTIPYDDNVHNFDVGKLFEIGGKYD